ncbi:uncharacterized protein EMH_0032710 [Eimeria mitis]|uniref:Uncharacterized protein n=1 Tax=Eimeria mitis TaxID=44415 RepID=U6KCV7_9EIME|nr:uncharacterized protein EMH_0032710 [Eimeria mitis]CDJ35789.1 hypothetical protein, conserved [Eimeria mitis]
MHRATMMTAQSAGCIQEIGEATDSVLNEMNLRSFLLRLPLPAKDAAATVEGICEKLMKNRSASHTKWNPVDANTEQPDLQRTQQQVNSIRTMLDSNAAVGFVLVIVENPQQEQNKPNQQIQYCPVAGAVLEVLDSYERSVRAIWCRRSLPSEVSEVITRLLVLRLFAYGFASSQQMVPHMLSKEALAPTKSPVSNRLISCTEESVYLFPRDAVLFMKTQLCMSKHWETPLDGGSHIDHPKAPCRCSSVRHVAGAWQFSGISLSRFVNYWRNHGRAALLDVPASALSYFAQHDRPVPTNGLENGAKRPRRHLYDYIKTAEERKSQTPTTAGDTAAKDMVQSERTSDSSHIVAATRRGLRRARSIPSTSHHLPAQRRRTGTAGIGVAARKSCRGTGRISDGPRAVYTPKSSRRGGNILHSRQIATMKQQSGLIACTVSIAAATLKRRSRREF